MAKECIKDGSVGGHRVFMLRAAIGKKGSRQILENQTQSQAHSAFPKRTIILYAWRRHSVGVERSTLWTSYCTLERSTPMRSTRWASYCTLGGCTVGIDQR